MSSATDKIISAYPKSCPGVKSEVQSALSTSLTRVLTPKTSTDILLEIQRKRSASSFASPDSPPDPYAMTFVGVNGVGKSTNLSKVCFWLLQNGMRVLIAACDTFRSGAVEQLRVHVRNLGALGEEMGEKGGKKIELYERGYGKDAAGIAKDAIAYGGRYSLGCICRIWLTIRNCPSQREQIRRGSDRHGRQNARQRTIDASIGQTRFRQQSR